MRRSNDDKRSEATKRQELLAEELGIDTYARYPRELIEFMMDRPPVAPADRAKWKPVHGPKTRVYFTYMRYSWCWPICLRYAVVTDPRDEIRTDHKDRPIILTEEAVAEILGMSAQRVGNIVLELVADKRIRIEPRPGAVRQGGGRTLAVFLEAKPSFTEEERQLKSTLVLAGIDGPRLEPAVARRFSNLLKQLGDDDRLLTVPPDGSNGNVPKLIRAQDYRTLVWGQILDNRTVFLNTLKTARYSERQAYAVISTRVRNLIDQTQSSDTGYSSSSSSAALPVAPATEPQKPRPVPATSSNTGTTTTTKEGHFYQRVSELFTTAGKGSPTPRQLATAWKMMPADAEYEDLEIFLVRPKGQARMDRIAHPGALVAVMGEFAAYWHQRQRLRADRESKQKEAGARQSAEAAAQLRKTLEDPHASEAEKQLARELLGVKESVE
jgi:hypothetical protein